MATAKEQGDGLGIYYTTADADGVCQVDADASLGGWCSGTEYPRVVFRVDDPIPQLIIENADCVTGESTIQASSASAIKFKAAGGSYGSAVTIADGSTVLVQSNDKSYWARVRRDGSASLSGTMTVDFKVPYNALFDDVTAAQRVAGHQDYRALAIKGHGSQTGSATVSVTPFADPVVTDAGQLGAAGAGTIETTGSFASFPANGWVTVLISGITIREQVYYTSRTDTVLTVPAAGRALLGTAAGAGAATDTVVPIGGVRIGKETPVSSAIEAVANETTAPSGVTWQTTQSLATGAITKGDFIGLWVHRHIPAGAIVDPKAEIRLRISIFYDSTTWNPDNTYYFSSYYRIADSTKALYELYVGEDASPDFSAAAAETSATLPFTHALTPPGSGTTKFHLVCRQRNQYNLLSYNIWERFVEIDSTGAEVVSNPAAPFNTSLTEVGGGYVLLRGEYSPDNESSPASHWRYYISGDADDPNTGTDTAVDVFMERNYNLFGSPTRRLNLVLGPYAIGTDLRILLRTYRTSDGGESVNTTALTATIAQEAPVRPAYIRAFHADTYGQEFDRNSDSGTTYIDQSNNIRWIYGNGYVDLYGDTVWIWRIRYDSSPAASNGIYTTYQLALGTQVTGTPSATPIEVLSWTAGDKRLSISANNIRRFTIDVTNSTLTLTSIGQARTPVTAHSTSPLADYTFHSLFQVFDPCIGDWTTACSLDYDGVLRMPATLPWKQVADTGDIP